MKKIFFSVVALLFACGAGAQTVYDAVNIAQRDLNGTARFVGMGGAMGALGGDLSTMGTNPAGIGIYRSNDASVTFGYNINSTDANYQGNTFTNNKYRWSLDNAGFVYAMKIGNQTSLRYVNFGFSYNHSKSLYRNLTMSGNLHGESLTNLMATQADGITPELWSNQSPYENTGIGWLSALGYNSYLINPSSTTEETKYPDLDENNQQRYNDEGKPLYLDYGYYVPIASNARIKQFQSQERGGVDKYDFNMSFNVNDRFFWGVTFGFYNVDYQKNTLYEEEFSDGTGFILGSQNRIKGSGFDVKLGFIARPIEGSPLRFGLAVHTPIFYDLTHSTNAFIDSEYGHADTWDEFDGDMHEDFKLRTPWVVNASLGYTIGKNLALGAEYEYEDYSSMKVKKYDIYSDEFVNTGFENSEISANLKATHTFRLGMEYKPISSFAFRLGYNYTTTAFKKDAFKNLQVATSFYEYNNAETIHTDADFNNTKDMHTFTLGVGFKQSIFYADLAFKHHMYKSEFFPYAYVDGDGIYSPAATKVDNKRSQVMLTLGVRF